VARKPVTGAAVIDFGRDANQAERGLGTHGAFSTNTSWEARAIPGAPTAGIVLVVPVAPKLPGAAPPRRKKAMGLAN
jgi:hypothetical protein